MRCSILPLRRELNQDEVVFQTAERAALYFVIAKHDYRHLDCPTIAQYRVFYRIGDPASRTVDVIALMYIYICTPWPAQVVS